MATGPKRTRPKMTITGPSEAPKPVGTPEPLHPMADPSVQPTPQKVKPRQQSRIGKRAVTFYVSPEAFRQLGVLSAQTDKTIQKIMEEALDWVFQQHDMHRIAGQ